MDLVWLHRYSVIPITCFGWVFDIFSTLVTGMPMPRSRLAPELPIVSSSSSRFDDPVRGSKEPKHYKDKQSEDIFFSLHQIQPY